MRIDLNSPSCATCQLLQTSLKCTDALLGCHLHRCSRTPAVTHSGKSVHRCVHSRRVCERVVRGVVQCELTPLHCAASPRDGPSLVECPALGFILPSCASD